MPQQFNNDELELGEVLQTELVRRVMALEGREETLRVNNAKLDTTIEALDECTQVSREDIIEIARELSRSAAGGDGIGQINSASIGRRIPVPATVIGLLAIVACITAAFMLLKEEPDAPGQILAVGNTEIFDTYRKKAELMSAMADVAPLRMMLIEYYYSEGVYPDSIDELGYDSESLVSNNVAGVTLEPAGALVVQLPDSFGSNKHFKLAPSFAMGGTVIEWECMSNLSTSLLTGINCKQG